jgi:sporulation protein YlmC with PRC-barrel domain
MSETVDLALGILDHQLVDDEGRRCGKVDDLELELGENPPRVSAIIVGTTAWRDRSRLGALLARLLGVDSVRIPWEEVASIESAVQLRRTARELRLGRGDDRYRALVERLPGAEL